MGIIKQTINTVKNVGRKGDGRRRKHRNKRPMKPRASRDSDRASRGRCRPSKKDRM